MAYVVSQTQSQAMVILKSFLQDVTGIAPTYVVQGQSNRVPAPSAATYIVFTPFGRRRLDTNSVKYSSSTNSLLDQQTLIQSTQLTVQVDVYGVNSADIVQTLSTVWRSGVATAYFQDAGFDQAPLYASEPRQLPFHDESTQVETRWSIDLEIELNIGVTSPQDFADSLAIGLYEVDAEWPTTA